MLRCRGLEDGVCSAACLQSVVYVGRAQLGGNVWLAKVLVHFYRTAASANHLTTQPAPCPLGFRH